MFPGTDPWRATPEFKTSAGSREDLEFSARKISEIFPQFVHSDIEGENSPHGNVAKRGREIATPGVPRLPKEEQTETKNLYTQSSRSQDR